jgi:uncharacterized protein YjbJ (UPF0337 family)
MSKQTDRWNQVKSKIISEWSKLSDNDLERSKGNISSIAGLVMEKYDESKQDVASKLVDVMHAVDSDDDLDSEQDGIVVDSRDPGSKEWDARDDVNKRL